MSETAETKFGGQRIVAAEAFSLLKATRKCFGGAYSFEAAFLLLGALGIDFDLAAMTV